MSKTVLITGATGGVAPAVAGAFAGAGWTLALFGNDADRTNALRRRHPDAHVAAVDLTDESAARQAVRDVLHRLGRIDAVLNIAGGFSMQEAAGATARDHDRMFGINFRTLFNTTRAVLPHLLDRGEGFLLGVSAGAGITGGGGMALYAAAKAAVAAYLKSLQAEVEPRGVRVSILYLMGAVDTPANRADMPRTDPAVWIDPAQVAEALLFLATRTARGHVRELHLYPPAR